MADYLLGSSALQSFNQVPGPGTYAPELSMKGYDKNKGYTMAQKTLLTNKQHIPGPGSYTKKDFVTISTSKPSSLKGDFGKEKRDKSMAPP